MQINVQGGTNAGWRIVRQQGKAWHCSTCDRWVEKYWTRCPSCGVERPV